MNALPSLRSTSRLTVVFLALTAAALACGCTAAHAPGAGASSAKATDFTLRALDGSTVRLSDHLGQEVVMLSFWATWCGPCLGEMPALENLHKTYKAQGFRLLSVAMDGPETMAEVEPTARRYGLTYPVLLDQDTRVVAVYNPTRDAPFTVLIGRDGRIAETKVGYSPGDEKQLEEKIRALVAESPQGAAK
jgi:peroxiredoxin